MVPIDGIGKDVCSHVLIAQFCRKRIPLINDAPDRNVPPFKVCMGYVLEETVCMWVLQWAMLSEVLDVISSLDLMQHGVVSVIRAGDHVAMSIEIGALTGDAA